MPTDYSIASFYTTERANKALPNFTYSNELSFKKYALLSPNMPTFMRFSDNTLSINTANNIIANSGINGCGGSLTSLSRKYNAAIKFHPQYLIINGSEGEPYSYKDHYLMKHYPQILIEGIAIVCHLLKIKQAILVINAAYNDCYQNMLSCWQQVSAQLPEFTLKIIYGPKPDLYVMGEETALINYIEGKRGEPNNKPPFPHEAGLYGKPTVVNNVETICWLPLVLNQPTLFKNGHHKLITITGQNITSGIYETKIGEPLSNILELAKAQQLAFIEIGGISGGFVPIAKALTTKLDNIELIPLNAMVGAGSIKAFANIDKAISEVKKTVSLLKQESCGRCTPCRVGTQRLEQLLLNNLEANETEILQIAETMQLTSSCGFGKVAPLPLLSYIKNFKGN